MAAIDDNTFKGHTFHKNAFDLNSLVNLCSTKAFDTINVFQTHTQCERMSMFWRGDIKVNKLKAT